MKYILTLLTIVTISLSAFILTNKESKKENLGFSEGDTYNGVVREQNQSGNLDQMKASAGVLGSVVITGSSAGYFELYDATTTNSSLRVPQATTSLRLLASFPVNPTVGTYDFNVAFTNGLIAGFVGVMPTTTITWR